MDDLEVRDNLTNETWPVMIEDQEVKRLFWFGPTGGALLGNQKVR